MKTILKTCLAVAVVLAIAASTQACDLCGLLGGRSKTKTVATFDVVAMPTVQPAIVAMPQPQITYEPMLTYTPRLTYAPAAMAQPVCPPCQPTQAAPQMEAAPQAAQAAAPPAYQPVYYTPAPTTAYLPTSYYTLGVVGAVVEPARGRTVTRSRTVVRAGL